MVVLDDLQTYNGGSVGAKGSAVSELEELPEEVILRLDRLIDAIFHHDNRVILELGLKSRHDGRAIDVEGALILGQVGRDDDCLHGRVSSKDQHVIEPVILIFSRCQVEDLSVPQHHFLFSQETSVKIMRLDLTKVKASPWVELLLELLLLIGDLLTGSARLLHFELGKIGPRGDTSESSLALACGNVLSGLVERLVKIADNMIFILLSESHKDS